MRRHKWKQYVIDNHSSDYKALLSEMQSRGMSVKENGTPITTKDIGNTYSDLKLKGKLDGRKMRRTYTKRAPTMLTVPAIQNNRTALVLGTPSEIAAVLKAIA